MNATSSRSHAIFTITIERSEKGLDGQQHLRMGKLHMVDLAVSSIHKYPSQLLFKFQLKQYEFQFLFDVKGSVHD